MVAHSFLANALGPTNAWRVWDYAAVSDGARNTYVGSGQQPSNSDTTYLLDDTPAGFASVLSASLVVWHIITTGAASSSKDDTYQVLAKVTTSGGVVLAAADSAGTFELIFEQIPDGIQYESTKAFTYVNTAATAAQWDDAVITLRANTLQNMASDDKEIRVSDFRLDADVELSATPIALDGTGSSSSSAAAADLTVIPDSMFGQAESASSADAQLSLKSSVVRFDLPIATDPGVDTDHLLRVRAKGSGAIRVTLAQAGVALQSHDVALTASFETSSIVCDASLITDYGSLELWAQYVSDDVKDVEVSQLHLQVPLGAAATVVNVGQAVEADTARPLSVTAIVGVGQAVETSSAHPAGRVTLTPVGQAVEADQAHPVTTPEPVSVALAAEASSAHPVSGVKVIHVGQAVETALAHPVDRIASVDVGRAIEVAQARPIAVSKVALVGQATETDTSHPVVSGRAVDLAAGGVAGSGVVADLRGEYQFAGEVIGDSEVVGHLPLGGLEASTEGSSGASAELQRFAELTSAAAGGASVSGELLHGVGLASIVASSSAASSDLNIHAAISGSSTGASSTSGAITQTQDHPLAGDLLGSSDVSTSLALAMAFEPVVVVGEALVRTDALAKVIDLDPGSVGGTSSTSGDVVVLRGLDASVLGFTHVTSDVRRNISLSGQVSSESTVQFRDFERQRDLSGLVIGFAVVLQTNIWTTEVVPVRIEVSAEFVGVALSATGAV